jgi:GT2 family glycosyltransferase
MNVSIVIVSFNVADLLNECLRSIKRETSCEYEIFVVDNGSKDNSVPIVKAQHPDVQVIQNETNLGFARANNRGFRLARGRYIFMLNPDTLLSNGTIDKLLDFMDNNSDIGVCGPKVLNPDLTIQYTCHHFPSISITLTKYLQLQRFFPRIRLFGRELMTYWKYDEIKEVDWITGCALLIRQKALEDVGYLDENYFMYSEECDLSYRMKKNNLKTVFFPGSTIIHYGGQSAFTQKKHSVHESTITNYLFESKYYFFKKNHGQTSEFIIRVLDLMYYSIVLLKNKMMVSKKNRKDKISFARSVILTALNKT